MDQVRRTVTAGAIALSVLLVVAVGDESEPVTDLLYAVVAE